MATKIIAVPVGWTKDVVSEGEGKRLELEYNRSIDALDELIGAGWIILATTSLRIQGRECILYTLHKHHYTPKG